VLLRVLDARQLAIKLLSNVTYGYTAASFSGRMPMAELADAIVSSGRCLLEWAISYVKKHPEWRAEVVYGDTDSMFLKLKGRSVDEAHVIGQVNRFTSYLFHSRMAYLNFSLRLFPFISFHLPSFSL
jgi:DNA polymerase zeta